MSKKLLLLGFILSTAPWAQAQFSFNEVNYWVGSGSDSALLVIDFRNGEFDSCYAWGYLYNGNETGGDMLQAVASEDLNLSINAAGGFLNDVIYHRHNGTGGDTINGNQHYWSTWSGPDRSGLQMNAGLATPLVSGEWFALSFTDFNPADTPGVPIPAYDPEAFVVKDLQSWTGTGADSAVLVIDFLNGSDTVSFAWGYLFNDSTDAVTMLSAIATQDSNLIVNAGSFLNDISYLGLSGIGGSPNFWATWSATNIGNWRMNRGISTTIKNGDFFGCSYTDFAPPLRPRMPKAVGETMSLAQFAAADLSIYPNPSEGRLMIEKRSKAAQNYRIIDASGRLWKSGRLNGPQTKLDLQALPKGIYWFIVEQKAQKLIIH
jgi:hypothetical protein